MALTIEASSMAYSKGAWQRKVDQLSTAITQTNSAIELKASQASVDSLGDDVTLAEAKISLICDKIGLTVSSNGQTATLSITPDMITQIAANIDLTADRISLEGYTSINNKFRVDKYGNMMANGGKIGGYDISSSTLSAETTSGAVTNNITLGTKSIALSQSYNDTSSTYESDVLLTTEYNAVWGKGEAMLKMDYSHNSESRHLYLYSTGGIDASGMITCDGVTSSNTIFELGDPLYKRYGRVFTGSEFQTAYGANVPASSSMVVELGRRFSDTQFYRYYLCTTSTGKLYHGLATSNATTITWTQI